MAFPQGPGLYQGGQYSQKGLGILLQLRPTSGTSVVLFPRPDFCSASLLQDWAMDVWPASGHLPTLGSISLMSILQGSWAASQHPPA